MQCFIEKIYLETGNRKLSVCAKEPIWVVLVTLLVLYAYMIRYWRHLLLTVSCTFLLTLFSWWFTDESVRWLVGNVCLLYVKFFL